MLKKTLKIIFVVFSICTIVLCVWTPALADDYNNLSNIFSPYGQSSSGLGLASFGGCQFIRGDLSSGATSGYMTLSDYLDVKVSNDSYTISGSGDQYGEYYIPYTFSGTASGVHDTYNRFLFPGAFVSTNTASPKVNLQYMRNQGKSSTEPSNYFVSGNTYYFHFSLYCSESSSINNLKIFLRSYSVNYSLKQNSNVYVYDCRNENRLVSSFVPSFNSSGSVMRINVDFDEPVSNFLTVSVPFTIGSGYSHSSFSGIDGRYYYDVFRFVLETVSFSSGERAEAEQAAEDASGEGDDAVPTEVADGATGSFSSIVSAMSYNGTDAKLTIPSFTWGLGNIIPERTWFEGITIDFGAYIQQYVPASILAIVRALGDIAIVFFCAKELYNLISYVLVNRKADDTSDG